MKWTMKSAAFRALERVPFGSQLHYLAQRKLTKEWPRSSEDIDAYKKRAATIVKHFKHLSGKPLEKCQFVEIGAGRDLALAVALRTLGVGSITCIDIERLAKLDLVQHAAKSLGWDVPFDTWSGLDEAGIAYRAPENAERTTLEGHSIDCFYTSEVLEHIPVDSLQLIFADARRYLRDDGLMIHAIDYSDHFARSDETISRFNFLQFSDKEWEPHNTRFQYVNRMRHSDYINMLTRAGFTASREEVHSGSVPSEILSQLTCRFRSYSIDDLGILRSIIVSQKQV